MAAMIFIFPEQLIFEAAFLGAGIYARADILKKDKKGWHLIEVKKSSEVKDYHYQDAGVQAYGSCCSLSFLAVVRGFLGTTNPA